MNAVSDVIRPVDPSTGESLPEVPCTGPEALADIVAAASKAQQTWAETPYAQRRGAFEAFVEDLGKDDVRDRVVETIGQEMGKPVKHARAEVANVFRRTKSFFARAEEAIADQVGTEGELEVTTQWRPLGVVGVIAPWNFPFSTPHNLITSALLVGNGAVLKPSEYTPRTGALYHELLSAHLPPGLLGLVQGGGAVGASLVGSDVDMIAFTGSIRTGQAIMREAANRMKRLVLELGGKDPMVVLPGADLDAAAKHAVAASLNNSGQVCVAAERILVHESIHEDFLARVLSHVKGLKVGDPKDPETDLGPMATPQQRELVLAQIEDAKKRGARILVEGESSGPGFYLAPSVIDGVADDMVLATDETFGPVVAVQTFAETDEAVSRANDTRYGLGASVWGPVGPELDAVANRIEAGMVGVNRGLSAAAGAPWVGWKMSGFGYSRSTAGMRQFLQPRTQTRRVAG